MMLAFTMEQTKGASSSQYCFQNEQGNSSTPSALVVPMLRMAFFVVSIPTLCSSKTAWTDDVSVCLYFRLI